VLPRSSHPPWFEHLDIWWEVQLVKPLATQLSPASLSRLDPNVLLRSSPESLCELYYTSDKGQCPA
jgi:hypothetical protein